MTHLDSEIVRKKFYEYSRTEFSSPREEAAAAVKIYHYICDHYEVQIKALEAKLEEYQGHNEILNKLARIEYLISNPTAIHQTVAVLKEQS